MQKQRSRTSLNRKSRASSEFHPANPKVRISHSNDSSVSAKTKDPQLDRWEKFWFLPCDSTALKYPRIGLGLCSLAYTGSYLLEAATWFGTEGLMSTDRVGQIVVASQSTEAANWRWSLLYWIDSAWALNLFFAMLAACSAAMICGIGGRALALLLWLGIVSIANASWVLAEVGLIPLSLGIGVFVFAGFGQANGSRSPDVNLSNRKTSWNRLGIRLTQIHVIGFLLAYSCSTLLNENAIGEGLKRQLLVLGYDWLANQFWLCRLLHSILIFVPLIATPFLIFKLEWRRLTVTILCIQLALIGYLSGDVYFCAAIAAMLLVFSDREQAPQTDTAPSPVLQPQ